MRITATVLMVSLALVAFARGADELDSLRKTSTTSVRSRMDHCTLRLTGGFDVFRSEFIAIACKVRSTSWRQTAGRAPSLTAIPIRIQPPDQPINRCGR
jgi:hypothetical protein